MRMDDTSSKPFAYDAVIYPNTIFSSLAPDQLSAAAARRGWAGPDRLFVRLGGAHRPGR
jgi:hypothetical protein